MQKLKIRQGDWVVVCDGAKALILENAGDATFPNLKTREVRAQADLPTREIGTDAPGRSLNSVGSGRSATPHRRSRNADRGRGTAARWR